MKIGKIFGLCLLVVMTIFSSALITDSYAAPFRTKLPKVKKTGMPKSPPWRLPPPYVVVKEMNRQRQNNQNDKSDQDGELWWESILSILVIWGIYGLLSWWINRGKRTCPFCKKMTSDKNEICEHCGKNSNDFIPSSIRYSSAGKRKCEFCGKRTPRNNAVCENCGKRLNDEMRVCGFCLKNTPARLKYCQHCGKKIPLVDRWLIIILIIPFIIIAIGLLLESFK